MTQLQDQDSFLLGRFQKEMRSRIHHFEDTVEWLTRVNPTAFVNRPTYNQMTLKASAVDEKTRVGGFEDGCVRRRG